MNYSKTLPTMFHTTLLSGKHIFVFGNGGSASMAQHLASEILGTAIRIGLRPARVFSLTADSAVLTALANDFDYSECFSRQIDVLAGPGDIALGMTTSGQSPNVIKGLIAAENCGATAIAMTGRDGLHLDTVKFQGILIAASSADVGPVQEEHLKLIHQWCDALSEMKSEQLRSGGVCERR